MKKILFAIAGVAIVGAGIWLMTTKNTGNKIDKLENFSSKKITTDQIKPQSTDTKTKKLSTGKYINYDESAIAADENTKLLFFHAPWCPQCRELDADIKNRGVPDGVTIIKVDYDNSQYLRQKYGVTIQTTIVKIDKNGDFVAKYVAYDQPNLESVKQNLL